MMKKIEELSNEELLRKMETTYLCETETYRTLKRIRRDMRGVNSTKGKTHDQNR
jgi:hypothetical protein